MLVTPLSAATSSPLDPDPESCCVAGDQQEGTNITQQLSRSAEFSGGCARLAVNLVNPKFKAFTRPLLLALLVGIPTIIVTLLEFIDMGTMTNHVQFLGVCGSPDTTMMGLACIRNFHKYHVDKESYELFMKTCVVNDVLATHLGLTICAADDDGTKHTDCPLSGERHGECLPTMQCTDNSTRKEVAGYAFDSTSLCQYQGDAPQMPFLVAIGIAKGFAGTIELGLTLIVIPLLWKVNYIRAIGGGNLVENTLETGTGIYGYL